MKRIKIQFSIFLCLIIVYLDPALAGSLKQLWNKLKYDNQRLDYYQPYSPFNYLPDSYPAESYNNFNLMNNPTAESSNLHRTVISLQNGLQSVNNLQNNLANLPSSMQTSNNLQNLMAAESINNQQFSVLPQQLTPAVNHLTPEFLYDYGQKPYSPDSIRNLQSLYPGLSLSSLTPFLLLSSLGTLSHKSLGHSGAPLTGHVSNGFLKGLTTYLSSYLPSSPRQRKRQIDRNLPPALNSNAYSFKKMAPIGEPYSPFQLNFSPSNPKIKTTISSSIYGNDANFKKYAHFNNKKPVKYVKPKWVGNQMINKKPYNLKKIKNQIKYSKLMNESGFVSRVNATTVNKLSTRVNNQDQIKFSEADKSQIRNGNSANKPIDLNENKKTNQKSSFTNQEEDRKSINRSNDQNIQNGQNDKLNKKINDKLNEKLANEESKTSLAEEGQHYSIELTSNQPQTDNFEDIAEKLYSKIIKRISSKSNDNTSNHTNSSTRHLIVDDEKDVP